jgi:hypothetical protein
MKEPSRTFARVGGFTVVLLLVFLSNASSAYAQAPPHLQDSAFDRIATQTAFSQLPVCNAPGCAPLTEGGQAYTADYEVIEMVTITAPHDQEVFTWQAIKPDNTILPIVTVTYTA